MLRRSNGSRAGAEATVGPPLHLGGRKIVQRQSDAAVDCAVLAPPTVGLAIQYRPCFGFESVMQRENRATFEYAHVELDRSARLAIAHDAIVSYGVERQSLSLLFASRARMSPLHVRTS